MMTTQSNEVVLQIKKPVESTDAMEQIGKATYGERGVLTLLEANDAYRDVLQSVFTAVNAREELRVKVPPPADAEPTGVYWRTVKRDEDDLLEMLQEHVVQKYDLYLEPVSE